MKKSSLERVENYRLICDHTNNHQNMHYIGQKIEKMRDPKAVERCAANGG
jgi:hypothetical protein